MKIPKNQSLHARFSRILISGVFINLSLSLLSIPPAMWIFAILWVVGNASAVSGYCPIYALLGINSHEKAGETRPKEKKEKAAPSLVFELQKI